MCDNQALNKTAHLVLLALTLLPGCGPRKPAELTRNAALDSINRSPKFTPATPEFLLTKEQAGCGLQAGLWTVAGNNGVEGIFWGSRQKYALTSKGRATFSRIAISYLSPEVAEVTVADEHHRTVLEVTGITEYQAEYKGKQVDFDWRWNANELPEDVKRCIPVALSSRKGTAHFRLYDDGWRVEQTWEPEL